MPLAEKTVRAARLFPGGEKILRVEDCSFFIAEIAHKAAIAKREAPR